VTTNCTNGAYAVITLSQGSYPATGSSDTAPSRRLKNGGSDNYLSYTLYKDYQKTLIWPSSDSNGIFSDGTEQSTTVHGEITPGQNVPAGTYTDTVVATVTY
jgi:spore coat protein U-like protein